VDARRQRVQNFPPPPQKERAELARIRASAAAEAGFPFGVHAIVVPRQPRAADAFRGRRAAVAAEAPAAADRAHALLAPRCAPVRGARRHLSCSSRTHRRRSCTFRRLFFLWRAIPTRPTLPVRCSSWLGWPCALQRQRRPARGARPAFAVIPLRRPGGRTIADRPALSSRSYAHVGQGLPGDRVVARPWLRAESCVAAFWIPGSNADLSCRR